jgi:hypothetical protein
MTHIDGFQLLAWAGALSFIGLVVFFLLREFWTWYWKQSQQVELLKDIKASLQRLEQRGGAPAAP